MLVLVQNEVDVLLAKGAIKKVQNPFDEFISNIFLVPKKDGTSRPKINLKNLNEFVEYHHFKQENLQSALQLIEKDDFLTSIDLKDAYFSISINPDFQKDLTFRWKENLYSFTVLPFGLVSAPRVFTKLKKPVFAAFRANNIKCCCYNDDSLVINRNYSDCSNETRLIA